jgi:7-cyano-7-deazaguanine synthase
MKKALVVLSGGQDSTTCLAICMALLTKGSIDAIAAVTFDYGQRHVRELQAAKDIAELCGVTEHEIVQVGPILAGTSPLTDPNQPLEQYKDFASMDAIIGDRVEKTFVPMRNALFLTLAANRAVCMGATMIVTGVCEADNANYPDCRQDFIYSQERTINEALGFDRGDERYIHIWTPLMTSSKAKSIDMLMELGVNAFALLAFSHTAYDGAYPPVGNDHATLLRAEGFRQAGVADPLIVRAAMDGLMPYPGTENYDAYHARQQLGVKDSELQFAIKAHQARLQAGAIRRHNAAVDFSKAVQ